jgi:hypothetical protein
MWVWRSVVSGGDGKTLLASLAAAALLLGCTGPAPDAASARAPADPSADWLATAQRAIAEREYHASESEGVLQAPNRAHNLRTWFEPSGIRVHDRTAGGSPALVELRLAGVGRPGELKAPAEGEVLGEADRIEIRAASWSSGSRTRRRASSRASRSLSDRRGRAVWYSSWRSGRPRPRCGAKRYRSLRRQAEGWVMGSWSRSMPTAAC